MAEPCTVQLIAPSGWAAPETVQRGIERLRDAGCVVGGINASARRQLRFAGSDAERAADINALAHPVHPLPDVVMAVRGGYGAHRILPQLDYPGLRQRLADSPCVLVGHSDFTALQLALLAKAGVVSFAGPMLAYDFGGENVSSFTLEHFHAAITGVRAEAHWPVSDAASVEVQGTLWGGNLAVLCSLIGTPYLPDIEGGILFLEDTNEPFYRIERMLYQLHLAGVLGRQRALLLGDFSGAKRDSYAPDYDLAAVIAQLRTLTRIPILTGLPFGHRRDKLTLPVGAPAQLDVGNGTARLGFSGYPHITTWPASAVFKAACI